MKALLILTTLLLTGCSTNPYSDMSTYEKVWQASHLIDVAQTHKVARDPCFMEVDPVTSKVIGENPSTKNVLIWGAALSYGHAHASKWLDNKDWPDWVKNSIRVVDLGIKYDAVTNNYNIGIRLGKNNRHDRCSL